jgi:hypothetical protein
MRTYSLKQWRGAAAVAVTKLLKKSQGTLSLAGSDSVVQPLCCFALVHPNPGFYRVASGQC